MAEAEEVTKLLLDVHGSDYATRTNAEQLLRNAEQQHLPIFIRALVAVLADENKPPVARQMAGLMLKNSVSARSEETRQALERQWLSHDASTRDIVKQSLVSTLTSPLHEARHTAAYALSKIALVELGANEWENCIPQLLQVVKDSGSDFGREAGLEAIGYICEEIEPGQIKQDHSDKILTAVVSAMHSHEKNNRVRYYAARALLNSLEFIEQNMSTETERNYLMTVVCECTQGPTPELSEVALECLVKIASLYYKFLPAYITAFLQITFKAVRGDNEACAKQGLEFWNALAEVEAELVQDEKDGVVAPEEKCMGYILGALDMLVPLLTECLVKMEKSPEGEDEWTVANAASCCLGLAANVVGDAIVDKVLPFIMENVRAAEWQKREGAILAFGCILEGTSEQKMAPLIESAMPVLLTHAKDSVELVRDTTLWTIGKIAESHPASVFPARLNDILSLSCELLGDKASRVAVKAAWTVHNVGLYYEEILEPSATTSPLSNYFRPVVQSLLQALSREDAGEGNLRCTAHEALNAILAAATPDTIPAIKDLLPLLVQKLDTTLELLGRANTPAEVTEISMIQGWLCGALQVCTRKLGKEVIPFAPDLMRRFLSVFQTVPAAGSATAAAAAAGANGETAVQHEECLMAVGAIAAALEQDFEPYMGPFLGVLSVALKDYQAYQVCQVAVGVVSDLATALGAKLAGPYCDTLMQLLMENLRVPELNRNVKPAIVSCVGDIALSIGGAFEKYLQIVVNMLQIAGQVLAPSSSGGAEDDPDMVEWVNTLRENICQCYTGIIQGLKTDRPAQFLQYVPGVIEFIKFVWQDPKKDDRVIKACCQLIGDIANGCQSPAARFLQNEPVVQNVVAHCFNSSDETLKETGQWAMSEVKHCIQGSGA